MADNAAKPASSVASGNREAAAPHGEFHAPGNGSEAWLRAIVDSAVDGIITIDELGSITDLNPAVLRLFGYSADELIGQNVKILMPEPYHAGHDACLRNYRETGVRQIIGIGREVAGKRKDGSVFPLDLAVSEVQRSGRRMFTGIVRDISERKRIEGEWQKFVGLVENSSDFMAMASLSWELLYINKAGRQLLGIGPEQVKGMEVRDLWEEDTLPAVLKKAGPVQLKGGSFRFHGKVKHFVTGRGIDVDCNAFGILDPHSGEPLAMAFSLRDMRDQMHREQALRDGEARLKAIFDSAVDGIVIINERGIMEEVNPAARTIFGYEPGEMLGQNVSMLMPDPYRREHDQYMRTYRHTGRGKIIGTGREALGRRKDGTVFPIDLSVSEVPLSDRRLFTGIIRDISGRKADRAAPRAPGCRVEPPREKYAGDRDLHRAANLPPRGAFHQRGRSLRWPDPGDGAHAQPPCRAELDRGVPRRSHRRRGFAIPQQRQHPHLGAGRPAETESRDLARHGVSRADHQRGKAWRAVERRRLGRDRLGLGPRFRQPATHPLERAGRARGFCSCPQRLWPAAPGARPGA